jgi:lysyl-tRNA synthetase class 2
LSEYEREARKERLDALRESGEDPYPARVDRYDRIAGVLDQHTSKSADELEASQTRVTLCGRVTAFRSFGKLIFAQLLEDGATLQISAKKQALPPEVFAYVKKIDVGDFVQVEGVLWRTRTDELTVDASSVRIVSKALRPLPEKWHGLTDVEARFRQRHLDLLVNPAARSAAILRSRLVSSMRAFLDARDFLEVETPILQPIYGGAAARPFTTHHNTYDQKLFLRISNELYLKRLVIGGFDRVYEIGRNFRNEGISRKHNPEFTAMECYQAYADYNDMMELVESMMQSIVQTLHGRSWVEYQGQKIDFAGSWPRITMRDAIFERCNVDILEAPDLEALRKAIRDAGLHPGDAPSWGALVDDLFSEHVEPHLIQPVFVIDYPVEISPLAKRSSTDARLVERFEGFIAGFEFANAFSELNDPEDQRARFEAQQVAAAEGDDEAHPMDEDYLAALEQGLPPTGGLGMGVDRLAMVMADAPNLREVLLFPHLRQESES